MTKIDFKESEYDKAYETYKTQVLTIAQISTGFVTINATILGLGINFQKAWLFLLGSLVSMVIIAIARSGERASRVFLMRAVQLEDELGNKDDSVSSLWTAYFYGTQRLGELREIAKIKNIDEKMKRLRQLKTRLNWNKYVLLIYCAILGQIALAILLPLILGWEFF
jgi:hypothetical protein